MEKTHLEIACSEILRENYTEYYEILSCLLLLNPNFVEKNDPRLSAKITAILFDDELLEKPHLISQFIENPELDVRYTTTELDYTKKLLRIDPKLIITSRIVDILQQKIITEEFRNKLRTNIRWDIEKFDLENRARFVYKF
ncbi:MAG: hypothetical protein KGD59_09630 [Candidatus Heimdallarchaeota archaeon]|nr:hypothetical protein [Candidatus Heimdallarchaeota archaeon]MBY8994795.1 hypothetical protein [Candidatus Heimdallarchaeota archaeon]